MKAAKIGRTTGWLLFLTYLIVLSYLVFFSEEYGRVTGTGEYCYNLVLFGEIKRFIKYREVLGIKSLLINIAGNVFAFVPFGFFMPVVSPKDNKPLRVILTGFCFSLLIESLQLIFKIGVFDVDDLLLNTIGVAIGFIGFRIVLCIVGRITGHEKEEGRV